jgi:hypothetical protein
MSKPNPADLPGSMAILGLLIETPDMTVAEVAEGLKKRFAACRFDPSTARHTLRQMADSKRSHPRVTCTHRSPGRSRMQDRYRLTHAGVDEFHGWMYRKPIGTPALREALYGRIELCRLEDLPELIRIAREERTIATALYSHAKASLTLHLEHNRRRPSRGEPGPEDFLREVRCVLTHVTPEYWSWRSVHFDEIVRHLEDISKRAGIDFPLEPEQ